MSVKRIFVDMMNRKVEVTFPLQRIVSVVPSQTELLYDLGLDNEVIAITKFCVHPDVWFQTKQRVGGTKKLHIDEIIALNPDLIIANKEENTQTEIEELARYFPVWISDIKTIDDGLEMIEKVGELVDKTTEAQQLIFEIKNGFSSIPRADKTLSVAYFIWKNPWMTVGNDTFIHDIIYRLGWQNVYENRMRYPETDIEELIKLNPEIIFLSSEPYPFSEKHIAELQALLPNAKILLVDGEAFSWYGSRMKCAATYLKALANSI